MQHSLAHIPEPLAGLTIEEVIEFEMLDALPPFDDSGEIGWILQGKPTSRRDSVGLSFTRKQERAGTEGETAFGRSLCWGCGHLVVIVAR
jgi:hypothetical protein